MKKLFTSHGRLCVFYLQKFTNLTLLVSLLMLCYHTGFAQSAGKIQGTVLDEKAATLPGVTIKIKGTSVGTVTDGAGKFSMNADKGATLVFSFVGYTSKEVAVGDEKNINVNLSPAPSNLNEVVVVGYGTQKKVSLTSAVTSISSQEIVTTKNENVENMLTGKIAGLQVIQNTAEPGDFANNINIRGMGNPLVVIDGVQQPDFTVTGGTGDNQVGSSNILSRLNPNDIESVSVLKRCLSRSLWR
jgi:outer membrane receptor protein involved in Fe transport